jgi:hypothetical protein
MNDISSNPAASVDAPTRVCLPWLRLGRRATDQRRSAVVTIEKTM